MHKKLNEIIKIVKKYNRIIITGHENPDFDSFASAVGMYEICKKYNENIYIYIDTKKVNNSLNKGIQLLVNSTSIYKIIDKNQANNLIDKNTLLIIVDASSKNLIECKELLNLDTIILDHHIVDDTSKINSIYEIIDSNYSSVSEMVTFFLDYLKIDPLKEVATLLLLGIEVDTNSYVMKTTSNTYLAASKLLEMGADNSEKAEILKETRENYIKKGNLIKRSYMVTEDVILCILDGEIYNQKDLAEVADELIQFEDVEASFVIGKIDKEKISISARSLGKIDVQKIVKQLGGGGSPTSAAVQFESSTIKDVKNKLLKLIK
ncbi:MAG: DHH family phosphoesterase [Clostridium sp.]|nr:DHH family phosphoesterase [Clostridium sp.]MCM1443747.1 DHH family phosphoesterase [Candidatus Amulumruptor caecigallinarius]